MRASSDLSGEASAKSEALAKEDWSFCGSFEFFSAVLIGFPVARSLLMIWVYQVRLPRESISSGEEYTEIGGFETRKIERRGIN